MELGKAAIYGLFVMICVNAAAGMLVSIGINTTPLPAWNENNIENTLNATNTIESWAGADSPFYDMGTGLVSWWNVVTTLIDGFPRMLRAFGTPSFITVPINLLWQFMWFTFVTLIVIAGRKV